jgi:anti-sigma factor RsiW
MRDEEEKMIASPTITWEALNAYVDDELAPDAAADVAAAVARDPDLAARVASLSRLRAATRNLAPEIGTPVLRLPTRRLAMSARVAALAASLVLAVGLSAPLWIVGRVTPDARPLSAAVAAHLAWLADARSDQGGRLQVKMAGSGASALPDLTLASLTLVHLSLDPAIRQGGGVLAGYVGPKGCRIGLWISPRRGSAHPRPVAHDREGLMIRTWSGNETEYALLGRGIDSLRLDRIAALVARLTLREHLPSREQVAALDEARAAGSACAG